MAWERRQRGGLYYTRSHRVGGRVVREYVGTGFVGALAAAEDEAQRANRAAAAVERRRAEHDRLEALDRVIQEASAAAEVVAAAELLAAGYHRHHRGEWRARRGWK